LEKQILKIENKMINVIGVLYKIRKKINTKTSLLLYDALIESHPYYCNVVWGYVCVSAYNTIYILQKRALRLCLQLPKLTSSNTVFEVSSKLSIYDINKAQTAMFAHCVINRTVPTVLHNFFTLVSSVHSYGSRRKLQLLTGHSKSNFRKFSLAVRGPFLWNSLPDCIKEIPVYKLFKNAYINYLKDSYIDNILDDHP
jgi:hypothetical protein